MNREASKQANNQASMFSALGIPVTATSEMARKLIASVRAGAQSKTKDKDKLANICIVLWQTLFNE